MRYILLMTTLAFCASAFGDDFEETLCGTFPKDWWLLNRQMPTNCFRYVSNVQSVSGEKAFLNDFSAKELAQRAHNKAGHGYLCRGFPKDTNDWLVVQFCFRREVGNFSCEVRAPNKGGGGLPIAWWIAVNDQVSIHGNGKRGENPGAWLGPVKLHAWYRVTFCLPTVGRDEAQAEMALEQYRGNGRYEPIGVPRHVGLGSMRLTGNYNWFAFTGFGKSRYWIDDFSCHYESEKENAK